MVEGIYTFLNEGVLEFLGDWQNRTSLLFIAVHEPQCSGLMVCFCLSVLVLVCAGGRDRAPRAKSREEGT